MSSSDDTGRDGSEPRDTRHDAGPRPYRGGGNRFQLSPRTRLRLSTSFTTIVAVCLLVAVVGGYGVYVGYGEPDTTTESATVGSWDVGTAFEHYGVVQEDTAVFSAGQQLKDRALYFGRLTPTLEGTHLVYHDGDAETATVTSELRLVVRSVETSSEGTAVHWQESERLATTEVSDLRAGERHRTAFVVDTVAVTERIEAIRSDLGATPGETEVMVVANTVVTATVAGERHVDEREDQLRLSLSTAVTEQQDGTQAIGGVYRPTVSVTDPATYETTRTTEVPVEPSPVAQAGGPALLVLGLLGAFVVGGLRYTGALNLTPAERRRLAFETERADNAEWISRGVQPAETAQRVELDSLDGLIGVAIDSNRRVIEADGTPQRYVVIVDDVTYVFEPPADPADPVVPLRSDETEPAPTAEREQPGREDKDEDEDEDEARAGDDTVDGPVTGTKPLFEWINNR